MAVAVGIMRLLEVDRAEAFALSQLPYKRLLAISLPMAELAVNRMAEDGELEGVVVALVCLHPPGKWRLPASLFPH